eukprot:scaffold49324_cov60-Phaeocystis_antarctica.AAC.3
MGGRGGEPEAMQTWAIPGWPGANAKRERTITPPGWSPWNLGMGWSPARDMLEAHADSHGGKTRSCGNALTRASLSDSLTEVAFAGLAFTRKPSGGVADQAPAIRETACTTIRLATSGVQKGNEGEAGQVWLELWLYYFTPQLEWLEEASAFWDGFSNYGFSSSLGVTTE